MSLPIIIQPEAEEDIASAYGWYERQQPGLGRRFLDQLTAAFTRVADGPGMYDLIWEDVRSCRLRRFPYLIYFRIQPERIEVLAVLHGSRHPETWQDRT
jgi:plasmid stabilization system protein ParE